MDNRSDNEALEKIPVKYVLYAHYGNEDGRDFKRWKGSDDAPAQPVETLPGIRFLVSRFSALRELLNAPGYEGLVVLFYSPGLAEAFDAIAEDPKKERQELLEQYEQLRFADTVSAFVTGLLEQDEESYRRIRFVTALDLHDIFARVSTVEAEHLRWWFIGQSPDIHYDTPKIVEAIVRLRLLGNGVPVFRLDWDVLFSSNADTVSDLGLFQAIAICLKAYRLRLEDPSVATFLFSASYDLGALRTAPSMATFKDWRGAFATRVFPALPVVPKLIAKVNARELSWEAYSNETFSEKAARLFYGFAPAELTCDGRAGIAGIGGHPLVSVISGAFLCLSDGAILDLPPFSNFSLNVSWIDDHLKYCLHRELRHLTSVDLKLIDPRLSDAKLDDVTVQKARGHIDNLPFYVLNKYLPTLLWGTILDAWINPNSLLKCRPNTLPPGEATEWYATRRRGKSDAILPRYLQGALETGSFPFGQRQKLKKLLIAKALERITDVRKLWADLVPDGHETFASIWAKASVPDYFPDLTEHALGIAPGTHLTDPIRKVTQLNPSLWTDFEQVIEDTLQYVEWTIHWPGIVRIVRSIEQGTIRTDMAWPLPEARRSRDSSMAKDVAAG